MSVARTHHVKRSQKDQGKCGSCGDPLPKGSAYLWYTVGFRSPFKHKRCMKPGCFPKPSERESSKAATILAALESFDVAQANTADELEDAVNTVAEAVWEVAEEYREAADAWEHGNESLEEKAEHYEMQADDLESFQADDPPDREDCESDEEYDDAVEEWRQTAVDTVESVETL